MNLSLLVPEKTVFLGVGGSRDFGAQAICA